MGFPSDEVEVKGVALRGVLDLMTDRIGPEFLSDLRQELSADHARLLEGPVLAVSWYPVAIYRQAYALAQDRLHRGPDLARELSREAVLKDFQGVYKVVAGALKPEWLISFAPRQFKRYFRGPEAVVEEAREGYARWRVSECHGFDPSMWEDVVGGCIAILESCGAKRVRARISRGGTALSHATMEFFWV